MWRRRSSDARHDCRNAVGTYLRGRQIIRALSENLVGSGLHECKSYTISGSTANDKLRRILTLSVAPDIFRRTAVHIRRIGSCRTERDSHFPGRAARGDPRRLAARGRCRSGTHHRIDDYPRAIHRPHSRGPGCIRMAPLCARSTLSAHRRGRNRRNRPRSMGCIVGSKATTSRRRCASGATCICLLAGAGELSVAQCRCRIGVMRTARRELVRLCSDGVSASASRYAHLQQREAASRMLELRICSHATAELEQARAEAWREAAHDLRGRAHAIASASAVLTRDGVPEQHRTRFSEMLRNGVQSLNRLLRRPHGPGSSRSRP